MAVFHANLGAVPKVMIAEAITRDAIVKAFEREAKKAEFVLSGRGHEPRVTLNRSMAALLKQCNLPRVTISGYGANNFYPARAFTSARTALLRKLGCAEARTRGHVDPG